MRFDDMIATVLAQPADRPDRIAATWRQLVDLLAQRRSGAHAVEAERAYAFLRLHRAHVDGAVRREAAAALAGLAIDRDLVAFFLEDRPGVAAPLIAAARLEAQEWLSLLPQLRRESRALLRRRADLAPQVEEALAELEAREAPPPAEPGAAGTADHSDSTIRELVDRIETFRRQREEEGAQPPAEPGPVESFRWETGSDGIIRWVEGAPREALVGQSLAAIAVGGRQGVDGQVAGAFAKRAPFRDGRFGVGGNGPASGDWRLSGVPFFDPARGSFLGYRGTARRPRVDEIARNGAGRGVFGTGLPADSLRQLIHELRTPLNAIIGFAELIEGEHMGPAAESYRDQAGDIAGQARQILSAVDDLDTAARIETNRLELGDSQVDAAALLRRLHEAYGPLAEQRGTSLRLEVAEGLPAARVEGDAAERMFARLLAATIGLAGSGETIVAAIGAERRGDRSMLRLAVDRPKAIANLSESALLDPGYSPEGDWPGAPALGLGFALRLVRNLAEAAGGALVIGGERMWLYLPAAAEGQATADRNGQSG